VKILSKYACSARDAGALRSVSLSVLAVIGAVCGSDPASATPLLGSDVASFTVLGASTVTNVRTSTVVGNVGVWSSGGANAITGFNSSPGVAVSDPQVTAGTVQAGTTTGSPNAMSAQLQLTTAITNLGLLGPGTLEPADLSGLTLKPGVYTVPAGTTNLSGTLTLDGNGNANAAWVFLMPSTLITSPNSVVIAINTGPGAGVYWDVGSSATIDTNTTFLGNILALTSIAMNTTATDLCGRALAETGAVTLQQNSLSGTCSGILTGSSGLSGGLDVTTTPAGGTQVGLLPPAPVSSVPEPATLSLLALGLVGAGFARKSKRKSAAV
jgi:Ice-binding-like/PEP-CTERM motif